MRRIASTELVFLRKEALKQGYDDKDLRRALHRGELVRVRQGAYAFASRWNEAMPEERHLIRAAAVVRQARCTPVLSHVSAALCLGADVWDLALGDVHVTRKDLRGGRREAGVAQHRGKLTPGEVTMANNWRCTSATRTALDVTTMTDVEHALVVVNSLLHEGLTTKEDLLKAAALRQHVPRSLTTRLVLELADSRIESAGESRTLYALWSQGLPLPVPQVEVRDERGAVVGRVDFAWPHLRVWVEFDGRAKYEKFLRDGQSASEAVVLEKSREDEIRRLTGWVCVRLTWDDLRNPMEIARKVRLAMAGQQVAAF